jgi:aminoglycoside phosphotransferase family enzyme/predicted kinase
VSGTSSSGGPAPVAVAETHTAAVVFFGDRAYKVKKPVLMDFLDFRTVEARWHVCRRELELNRRLAPDVYLGVAELSDPCGGPPEPLVVMRRMPAERRLSTLVRSGAAVGDHLRRLAHLVAAFHASPESVPTVPGAGGYDDLRHNWDANTLQLERFIGPVLDGDLVRRVASLASRYLAGRKHLFDERLAAGLVRDGHGDLLADDIFCLDDGPRVLDCLEFDDALRHGDVLADVAFLAMDLERLGAPEAAARFLAWYDESSGRTSPASLVDHYVAYRAQVRAKVSCIRYGQGVASAAAEARHLLALSSEHLERARVRLVLVGGLPGTGKSTVAQGLGDALGWPVLSSDEVRKELAGLSPLTSAPAPFRRGLYAPERTDTTYTELLRRAREAMARGSSVIVDASWSDGSWRERAANLANTTASDLVPICCEVADMDAEARLHRRAACGEATSDATPAVRRAMAGRWQPWTDARTLSTERPVAEVLQEASALVRRPGALARGRPPAAG